jgi:hypothetical protein
MSGKDLDRASRKRAFAVLVAIVATRGSTLAEASRGEEPGGVGSILPGGLALETSMAFTCKRHVRRSF